MIYDLELPAILTSFTMCERRKVKYDVLCLKTQCLNKIRAVQLSDKSSQMSLVVIIVAGLHFVISCTMWCIVISYHYLSTGQISDIRYIKGLNVTKYCKSSRLSI